MKKLILVAFIAITSATFAQDSTKAANLKAKGIATYDQAWSKMDQVLNLSPEQTAQWQALNKSYAPQYKAIAASTTLSKDDKETQMTALHTQQEADLKKILTPKQDAQWTAIKKTVKTTAQSKAASMQASHVPRTPAVRTRQ